MSTCAPSSCPATEVAEPASPAGTVLSTTSHAIPATLLANASRVAQKGVSPGTVAGIAVATALVGAALALFAALVLFRRRKHSSEHPYHDPTRTLSASFHVKGSPYVQVAQNLSPLPADPPVASNTRRDLDLVDLSPSSEFLAGVLLPPADDETVKSKVLALFQEMQSHVDSFYRNVHATMTPSMEADLAKFSNDTTDLAEGLHNTSMPTIALKNALAGYVLSIVASEAEDQATLFPTELSGLKANERSMSTLDHQAAYILYRRLAVYLYSPPLTSLQSRQSDIREAAEHFSLTFFPWANPVCNDQDKDMDLVRVVDKALEVSMWLYGQPHQYDFVWESAGRQGTVIAPGLVQVTDSGGRTRQQPHVLLVPMIVPT